MISVIETGLETSIQDWPGRVGFYNKGFPPSGPLDSWSFRLANVLVGNKEGVAGLECQFIGPTLKFDTDLVVAITGADMQAKINGQPCPMWESFQVFSGQSMEMSYAISGARGYIAFCGGIASEPTLDSRSTFAAAGVGGLDGDSLKVGDILPLGPDQGYGLSGRTIPLLARPSIEQNLIWEVEAVPGPNDDWIDQIGHERFLSSDWRVSAKSNRMGMRLEGPDWTFTSKAYDKLPENGSEPANIIDHGYPIGAINLAGQTPIILLNDGPSMGGFINPYTVPHCALWKLGQARPGETFRFQSISVEEAQLRARRINTLVKECALNTSD
jgi:5-oxoprolinase (ATP-hydrolysing) subunit C